MQLQVTSKQKHLKQNKIFVLILEQSNLRKASENFVVPQFFLNSQGNNPMTE